MIKIIIVDNQEPERNNTQVVLSSQTDFKVVGIGKDGYDALKLVETLKPDIAILDICLDVIEGTEIIPLLRSRSPSTVILFLTSLDDEDHICKAIGREVPGYLLKDTDMDKLVAAVRLVHGGGRFISPKIEDKVYHIFSALLRNQELPKKHSAFQSSSTQHTSVQKDIPIPGISRTEFRIMTYICQGQSTKEIAENLCLATGTVRNYLSSVMQKVGLQHRTQIPLFAFEHGLTTLGGKR